MLTVDRSRFGGNLGLLVSLWTEGEQSAFRIPRKHNLVRFLPRFCLNSPPAHEKMTWGRNAEQRHCRSRTSRLHQGRYCAGDQAGLSPPGAPVAAGASRRPARGERTTGDGQRSIRSPDIFFDPRSRIKLRNCRQPAGKTSSCDHQMPGRGAEEASLQTVLPVVARSRIWRIQRSAPGLGSVAPSYAWIYARVSHNAAGPCDRVLSFGPRAGRAKCSRTPGTPGGAPEYPADWLRRRNDRIHRSPAKPARSHQFRQVAVRTWGYTGVRIDLPGILGTEPSHRSGSVHPLSSPTATPTLRFHMSTFCNNAITLLLLALKSPLSALITSYSVHLYEIQDLNRRTNTGENATDELNRTTQVAGSLKGKPDLRKHERKRRVGEP